MVDIHPECPNLPFFKTIVDNFNKVCSATDVNGGQNAKVAIKKLARFNTVCQIQVENDDIFFNFSDPFRVTFMQSEPTGNFEC